MAGLRSRKNTTEAFIAFDIRYLNRKDLLRPAQSFALRWLRNGVRIGSIQVNTTSNSIVLSYRHRTRDSHDWQQKECLIELARTPCHYGGERTWFVCPARGCGRRVAVLYGGAIFACRRCQQLSYKSQREQPRRRALRRAQTIRMNLGGSPNLTEPFPDKPKGMHWSTYQRLHRETEKAVWLSLPPWFLRDLAADFEADPGESRRKGAKPHTGEFRRR